MKRKKKTTNEHVVLLVNPWVYMQNNGDGSSSVEFFNTEEQAAAYAEPDSERYCDDIFQIALNVDPKTGQICNVKKREGCER